MSAAWEVLVSMPKKAVKLEALVTGDKTGTVSHRGKNLFPGSPHIQKLL